MTDNNSPLLLRKDYSLRPATGFFGKTSYKYWVLAAVLLLAFSSLSSGQPVTCLGSTATSTNPSYDDLDILEVEEREKCDVPGVRDSAFSEIAKISILTLNLDPLPLQSTVRKLPHLLCTDY
ncbi:hypothetical protein PanWU01x14_191910 [Parasponia andersonii]|uniref:Uncharacterized protein n=1 Tax=Parasponia andersonii TaxID=3476 RepID=A0A2P5C1S0_PARAD|nr:hypothetical protein PanWU01x14_191910 [Parasponia andersonii]